MINFPQRNWTDYGGEVTTMKIDEIIEFDEVIEWLD